MNAGVFSSIGICGGGAWGTALGILAANNNIPVTLWARDKNTVHSINNDQENTKRLPGITLPENLRATQTIADLKSCDAIVFAVPAQQARTTLTILREDCDEQTPLVICAKGIEQKNLILMPDVLRDVWPSARGAILSGPSFAADVAHGKPTAVTIASSFHDDGKNWQAALGATHFRPYLSDDVTGVALGGAVKNVLAIAAGIVDGMALGESARAALIARGFAEFQRLGLVMGARAETMAGLSGLGDLVLTASSNKSRNMALGQRLGRGESLTQGLDAGMGISEGVATASAVVKLADHYDIEMPICSTVAKIVEGNASVADAVLALLSRPVRSEGL